MSFECAGFCEQKLASGFKKSLESGNNQAANKQPLILMLE